MDYDIVPYIFCDNELSQYEKTIYFLSIAYANSPIYKLSDEDVYGLSTLLEVDYELLKKALESEIEFPYENVRIQFGTDIIECGEYLKNDLFFVIIKIYFMYKYLGKISFEMNDESLLNNIEVFQNLSELFETSNAIIATYECMIKNIFSYDNIVFDSSEFFNPRKDIDLLYLLETYDDCMHFDKEIKYLLSALLKYEFETRINSLYLITICQIFKHSPCFDKEMVSIAEELYNKLLLILKNGRIISTNVNLKYLSKSKPKGQRTKYDNTTRLQLIFGYSNYDCYELRLDFAHKGQEVVHFNNVTPGGTSCCILSKSEFEKVIEEFPDMKDCFISYEGKWALKERKNCEINDDQNYSYDKICQNKSHGRIFFNTYSEEKINEFILTIAKMFPKYSIIPIDTDGDYARHCFNLNMLNRDATFLYLAYLSSYQEQVKKIYDSIANKEFEYGLCSMKRQIDSFGQVLEIIKKAENQLKKISKI